MLDQCCVIGPIAIRVIDVADDGIDGACRCLQSLKAGRLEPDFMVIDTSHETIQRRRHLYTALHIGHIGTAMQRMACTIQFVRYVERRFVTFVRGQVIRDDLKVAAGFFRENVIEHRVHFKGRLDPGRCRSFRPSQRQHGRIGVAVGKRIGPGYQQTDIDFRLGSDFELLDQFRHGRRRLQNEVDHRWCSRQSPVDQSVEQVFYRPAVFADALGTHHAATAFQRMERAPDRNECLHVIRGAGP